jgi:predicted ATPase
VGERLQTYIGQSGGADSVLHFGSKTTRRIEAELMCESEEGLINYLVYLTHAAPDSLLIHDERLVPEIQGLKTVSINIGGVRESRLQQQASQGDANAKAVYDLLSHCRVFHFHDSSNTAKIRLTGYIEANQYLYSDASNLGAMLYLYQQTKPMVYRRIVAAVRSVFPVFDDFVLEPQRLNPKYILLNWRQIGSDHLFGPHQLSDGSLRAIALITLFLHPEEDLPGVVILDEPELGLHPYAIGIIAGLIRAASLKTQVILATQSQAFVDCFDPEEIVVVELEGNNSIYQRLETEKLREWLEDYSVGELWEKNVLGGGPLP